MKTEKRQQVPRIKFRQLAQIVQVDPETGERDEVMGSTIDIDTQGVRVEGDHGFRLGSQVSVTFISGERIIEVHGTVTHFSPGQMAAIAMDVAFNDLSDSDRQFIEQLCRKRASG